MRYRISQALLTAAAGGLAITLVSLASASAGSGPAFTPSAPQAATNANCAAPGTITGTYTSADCGKAGYVATGRDFRYAQALITVPDHTGSVYTDPTIYVSLDGSASNADFARAGVRPCVLAVAFSPGDPPACGASGWQAFVLIEEPGTPTISDDVAISAQDEGDGVFVSVYFNQAGDSVHAEVIPPSGASINNTYHVNGPVYTDAQAFADWTADLGTPPNPAPPSSGEKVRDTQFLQGRFTTLSGARGTFAGPWSLTAVDATSNGHLFPSGTVIAQPSYLWTDLDAAAAGFGRGVPAGSSDAFGVWRYGQPGPSPAPSSSSSPPVG
jgi:hypothetical protein